MKIIIVGAGIGGLTAAAVLAGQGHEIQVLEQTPEPKPVGAGISLQPNAMQALATLGLDRLIAQRGWATSIARISFSDGRLVREMNFSGYSDRYHFLPHAIHRAELFDILYQAASDAGATIRFGASFESFSQSASGVCVRACQQSYDADALIGADGIHSRVRTRLFGEQPTRYSGYVCWRGIVSEPATVASVDTMNEIWGDGSRFGFLRCRQDQVYWFATKTHATRDQPSSDWRDFFRDWPNPVSDLIQQTPDNQVAFNDISDRKPSFPWSKGRVTLLGDAAHPMTPNFGQGGAQAIEDAVVLGRAFAASLTAEAAFQEYQRHRHPRTSTFVNGSWNFGRVAQGGNAFWRFARRRLLPLIPESTMPKMLDRQYGFQEHLEAFPV